MKYNVLRLKVSTAGMWRQIQEASVRARFESDKYFFINMTSTQEPR
jgi:hypothetical protein